jgi:hypothetical protein
VDYYLAYVVAVCAKEIKRKISKDKINMQLIKIKIKIQSKIKSLSKLLIIKEATKGTNYLNNNNNNNNLIISNKINMLLKILISKCNNLRW